MKEHNYAGYQSGCRCEVCRKANARYRQELLLSGPRMVPADRAIARIEELRSQGCGYKVIADAAKIQKASLQRIVSHPDRLILKSTEAKILQASPELFFIPVRGTIMRIRALAALGYPESLQAQMCGRQRSFQVLDQKYVTPETAKMVLDLAIRIGDKPGPSDYIQKWAASKQWKKPIYYDEDDFYSLLWDGLTPRQRKAREISAARKLRRAERRSAEGCSEGAATQADERRAG